MAQEKPALKMIREFVAVGRSIFERPCTSDGDPNAQRKLVEGIEVQDEQGQPLDVSGPLVEFLAPRAPFFDLHVLNAIKAGITQIVNVGAGYDDRALRFQSANTRYFEIDLPHVVDDKAHRLGSISDQSAWPTLIPADLRNTEVSGLLTAAGFEVDKPALFLCEHVLLFLERPHVQRLFTDLARIAAPGSTLASTVEVHPDDLDTNLVVSTVDETMFANTGLLQSIRSRQDWIASMRESGWIVGTAIQETAVDHFALPVAGQTVQIQTQFMTATR